MKSFVVLAVMIIVAVEGKFFNSYGGYGLNYVSQPIQLPYNKYGYKGYPKMELYNNYAYPSYGGILGGANVAGFNGGFHGGLGSGFNSGFGGSFNGRFGGYRGYNQAGYGPYYQSFKGGRY